MNKKLKVILIILAVFIILVIPIKSTKDDGGTVVYNSLTYKVIEWHEENITYEGGYKTGKDVYFFPKNFKSVEYYSEQDAGERERNFGVVRIVDNSEECALGAEKEMFHKVDNMEYYFPCEKSLYIEVIFNDKSTMLLQDALVGGYIEVSRLLAYGIEYEEVDTKAGEYEEPIPEFEEPIEEVE